MSLLGLVPAVLAMASTMGSSSATVPVLAHKGSYRSRDEHHQKEKFLFARTGQFQQTSRNDFGQTGLEHSSAHDK